MKAKAVDSQLRQPRGAEMAKRHSAALTDPALGDSRVTVDSTLQETNQLPPGSGPGPDVYSQDSVLLFPNSLV